jgi:hypothetical protein
MRAVILLYLFIGQTPLFSPRISLFKRKSLKRCVTEKKFRYNTLEDRHDSLINKLILFYSIL